MVVKSALILDSWEPVDITNASLTVNYRELDVMNWSVSAPQKLNIHDCLGNVASEH